MHAVMVEPHDGLLIRIRELSCPTFQARSISTDMHG